jgi:hypothetical protein
MNSSYCPVDENLTLSINESDTDLPGDYIDTTITFNSGDCSNGMTGAARANKLRSALNDTDPANVLNYTYDVSYNADTNIFTIRTDSNYEESDIVLDYTSEYINHWHPDPS